MFPLEVAIEQKMERVGGNHLTIEERTVLAIEGLEREVNNGGYSQFFTNSSGQYAPIIVDCLLRIQCPKTAALTQKAIAALGAKDSAEQSVHMAVEAYRERDRQRRNKWPSRPSPPSQEDRLIGEELDSYDQIFFQGLGEHLAGELFAYVRANRDSIQL